MPSWIASILLCTSLAIGVHAVPAEPDIPDVDKGILDLISTIIGEYDNNEQISVGCIQHSHIQARLIPVSINFPSFAGKCLILFELSVDGEVVLIQILAVDRDAAIRNVFSLIPHNITDTSKYRPGQFQVDDLKNVDFSQIDTDPTCVIRFLLLDDGSYSAVWPDCRSLVDGKHPAYIVTLTCTFWSSAVPLFSRERAASSVYFYKRQKINIPIPCAYYGYESPCEKLKRECPVLKIA